MRFGISVFMRAHAARWRFFDKDVARINRPGVKP
jgi:hypothetical protein